MIRPQENANDDVVVRELTTQPIISIRGIVKLADLVAAFDERMTTMRDYLKHHDVQPAGPVFVRYHKFPDIGPNDNVDELETDVEQGIPIASALPGENQIKAGELPGGSAVTADYVGEPQGLGVAYGRVATWMKEHHKESAGPAWEVYYFVDFDKFQGHPSLPDQKTWHHQIVQPIK